MAGRPILTVQLSSAERRELERQVRSGASTKSQAERARVVLLRADGLSQEQTAKELGCSARRVSTWVARFRRMGIEGLADKPGRGRKPKAKQTPPVNRRGTRGRKGTVVSDISQSGRAAGAANGNAVQSGGTEFSAFISGSPGTDPGGTGEVHASVRSVARAAGVSSMTASRVLRNERSVSAAVRRRVLKAAHDQGYRPDPNLDKLMLYLRKRRTHRLQGNICALVSKDWKPIPTFHKRAFESARLRAEELGFAFDTLEIDEFAAHPTRTVRMLRSRGVAGLVLPSQPHARTLPARDIWDEFSVIAASYSITEPSFHRVVPDQIKNIHLICKRLTERGCERIGLVILRGLERRTRYQYTGGFAAFHLEAGREMLPVHFRSSKESLSSWYRSTKPDAIIVDSSWSARWISELLGLTIPGLVVFAAFSHLDF